MKKINNYGFMLVETLVVSTFIFSTLVFLYVQFRTVNNSYKTTYDYNTVNSLYYTNAIKKYVLDAGYKELTTAMENSANKYIDITTCPVEYLNEINYCQELFETLKVKQVIFTHQDLSDLKQYLLQTKKFDDVFNNYIDFIRYDSEATDYRLVVSYMDNTFATLKVS